MNRGDHLRQTLNQNIRDNAHYDNHEFVILDYGSSDGVSQWVCENFAEKMKKGIVKLFRTDEPKKFHPAHAKNMSHRISSGDVVCNLDADNFTGVDFAFFIDHVMRGRRNRIGYNPYPHKIKSSVLLSMEMRGTFGRMFLFREHFDALGGYDEDIHGYGKEDTDFLERAVRSGLSLTPVHPWFLRSLEHSDDLRTALLTDRTPTAHRTPIIKEGGRWIHRCSANPHGYGRGALFQIHAE